MSSHPPLLKRDVLASLRSSLPTYRKDDIKSEGQTGAIAPSLDTSCTNRTASRTYKARNQFQAFAFTCRLAALQRGDADRRGVAAGRQGGLLAGRARAAAGAVQPLTPPDP